MGEADSIEIEYRDVHVILRHYPEPIDEINISNKSIEYYLNCWQGVLFEGDLYDPEVIKLTQTLELGVIDLQGCNHLAIVVPQGINFGINLFELLANESEPYFTEGDQLRRLGLNFECLTL